MTERTKVLLEALHAVCTWCAYGPKVKFTRRFDGSIKYAWHEDRTIEVHHGGTYATYVGDESCAGIGIHELLDKEGYYGNEDDSNL